MKKKNVTPKETPIPIEPQKIKVELPDTLISDKKQDLSGLYEETPELPKPPKEPEFNLYYLKTHLEECEKWKSNVQVSKWANKTGYDISHCSQNGAFQHLSLANEEMDLIIKMVEKLRNQ